MSNVSDWLEDTVKFERQRANDAERKLAALEVDIERLIGERDQARGLLANAVTEAVLAHKELLALRNVAEAARARNAVDESDEASSDDELAASMVLASALDDLDAITPKRPS